MVVGLRASFLLTVIYGSLGPLAPLKPAMEILPHVEASSHFGLDSSVSDF